MVPSWSATFWCLVLVIFLGFFVWMLNGIITNDWAL